MSLAVTFSLLLLVASSFAAFPDYALRILPTPTTAKCLDGTPAGYYIARNPLSPQWVVYLQGGAYCTTAVDCLTRQNSSLGSSKFFPANATIFFEAEAFPNDIYSSNATLNPTFSEANHVYVPYCSGDIYLGTRTFPIPQVGNSYFAGHLIVGAIFGDLVANYGLSSTSDKLILSGASAGGIGLLNNIDYVQTLLPNTAVSGFSNAGFFLNAVDFPDYTANSSATSSPSQIQLLVGANELYAPFVDVGCGAAQSATGIPVLNCIFGPVVVPFVTTPVFFAENLFDSEQIFLQQYTPENPSAPGVYPYIAYFGALMRASINATVFPTLPRNGLFVASCLAHVLSYNTYVSAPPGSSILAQSLQEAFVNWYYKNGKPVYYFDPASPSYAPFAPINPTCSSTTNIVPVPGCTGQSIHLTGGQSTFSSHLGSSVASLTDPAVFTVAIWVQINSAPTAGGALLTKQDSNGNGWAITVTPSVVTFSGNAFGGALTTLSVPASGWTQVTFTYDGTSESSYLNGVSYSNVAPGAGAFPYPATPIRFGSSGIDVNIAEIAVWNRVLSPTEIATVASGYTIQVSTTGLIAIGYAVTTDSSEYATATHSVRVFGTPFPTTVGVPSALTARCAAYIPAAGQKK